MVAFVTDGDERPALAVVRALGRRGIQVIVGSDRGSCLASRSRYCRRHVRYPSPVSDPDGFDRFLVHFARWNRVDVVMPVAEITSYLVTRNRPALKPYTAVAGPSFEAFDAVADKWNVLQRAAAAGIAIPRTHFVGGLDHLETVLDEVAYPAVVKSCRSRIRAGGGWLATSVQYARSRSELVERYRTTEALRHHPSLIQQRITGPGTGLFVLCDAGRVRATFAHRRLREKPPSGGVSVLCESIPVDRRLLEQARHLLQPLQWDGVAMLEYKDDASGRPHLMEINGRFWGSLQLAVDAGVDFPYLAWQHALGRLADGPRLFRVGLRSRWLLGDLDHLLARVLHSPAALELPADAPSRSRAWRDFLRLAEPGLQYDVMRMSDLRPCLYELRRYVQDAAGAPMRAIRRRLAAGWPAHQEEPQHVDAVR
jgi:predicted ATP-grasp superfamily ATP-dependent carboligase